jgi:uncharacterized membrane protein YdbT with pleckstrin-like domain
MRINSLEFYYYIIFFGGVTIIFSFILPILQRLNFHYFIENDFLTLKQGILAKQEKHIPYGVIQNIFIKQDLLDRVFGLTSLIIENASQGAGLENVPQKKSIFMANNQQRREKIETIGFSGNKVSIPGLTKNNAESLKEILLQKMKDNQIQNNQSGL